VRRWLARLITRLMSRKSGLAVDRYSLSFHDLVWATGSFCVLNRKPFDPRLLSQQFPPPYSTDSLVAAARSLGFLVKPIHCATSDLRTLSFPCLAVLKDNAASVGVIAPLRTASDSAEVGLEGAREPPSGRLAMAVQATAEQIVLFRSGTNTAVTLSAPEFAEEFTGLIFLLAPDADTVKDPDGVLRARSGFSFRWFVPELLKHKKVWRDVLIASLIIQVLALGTPLFTQVVVDKVVVHHTRSTLIVIGIGLAVFLIFTALLSWVRQYLVLHTGNRVDAVLGAAVFEHLFRLPPRYFEHRPTGVITARLRGVENIREFIASAAITLMLDVPFLLIFVAIMLEYSVVLTAISLAMIATIVLMSLLVAPVFRTRMNEQFLLSARNQAFTTEYIAGLETVKSLQMEPQLHARYGDYLAEYLRSGFEVRQIANTYSVFANAIEQLMSLLILVAGAWLVMNSTEFSIGMLVAFQMFASRVSQPMLRLVGLWQQFQQASLSVARLADIMNTPVEPYSLLPARAREGSGLIEIDDLSFRYGEDLPYLYRGFSLRVEPGRMLAIMGPSGSGKSTLSKLLQGFYLPSGGSIRLDGTDTRHFSANELRQYFGVVPQETVLFSGTIYDNLVMANPHATFEQIVRACNMAEIHNAIEQLPRGYQTQIGERGVGLSGGQKQRIAIARALLKQPKILIFDEATSSLDAPTAEHFGVTVNQLKGKVTMLFIAHALPRTLQVDEVVHIGDHAPLAGHNVKSALEVVNARG
jgi:subfamily B ATP-binding cassette protein HlyB/CyaB